MGRAGSETQNPRKNLRRSHTPMTNLPAVLGVEVVFPVDMGRTPSITMGPGLVRYGLDPGPLMGERMGDTDMAFSSSLPFLSAC